MVKIPVRSLLLSQIVTEAKKHNKNLCKIYSNRNVVRTNNICNRQNKLVKYIKNYFFGEEIKSYLFIYIINLTIVS